MSTSDTEPEPNAGASDSAMAKLLDAVRNAGPVGYVYVAALLLAAVVVVGSLTADDVASLALPEPDTDETQLPPDLSAPDSDDRAADQLGSELRTNIEALEQCLREQGVGGRVRSASETELVLGVRPGTDPNLILDQPEVTECIDQHLGEFDGVVSAVEITPGDDRQTATDRGSPDADGNTDIESTDSSTPPTQPTTDTTVP